MANYPLLALPSQMLTRQANTQVQLVLEELASPSSILTSVGLMAAASSAFNTFYSNLGYPLSSTLVFSGLPIAEEWNSYQKLLVADLGILYSEILTIRSAADNTLLFGTVGDQLLSDAIAEVGATIASTIPVRPTGLGLKNYIISDDFANTSLVDTSNSSSVQLVNGAYELGQNNLVDVTSFATLTIDDPYIYAALGIPGNRTVGGSNGFAGNLHEVTLPENTNPLTQGSNTDDLLAVNTSVISEFVQLNAAPGENISFMGDTQLHTDPSVMLDNDPTTWFEYEVCNIPDAFKMSPCGGLGFNIQVVDPVTKTTQLIPWWNFHNANTSSSLSLFPPPVSTVKIHSASVEVNQDGTYITPNGGSPVDPGLVSNTSAYTSTDGSITLKTTGAQEIGGVLQLVINASFAVPQAITQISILPNIIQNRRPTTLSVQVHDASSGQWIDAIPNSGADLPSIAPIDQTSISQPTTNIFTVPSTTTDLIRITIQQTQSYPTTIGHIAYIQQNAITAETDPQILNSLLGLSSYLDSQSDTAAYYKRVDGPTINYGTALTNPTDTVLDTVQDSSKGVIGPLIEAFEGWRYAIAVSSIDFCNVSYKQTGTLVTQNLLVPIDIKTVVLKTTELLPITNESVTWFKYEISLDGGTTYYPISPRSHYLDKTPRRYLVNPSVGTLVTSAASQSITTKNYDPVQNPVSAIKLRVTFNGPKSDTTLTPRLQGYKLVLEGIS